MFWGALQELLTPSIAHVFLCSWLHGCRSGESFILSLEIIRIWHQLRYAPLHSSFQSVFWIDFLSDSLTIVWHHDILYSTTFIVHHTLVAVVECLAIVSWAVNALHVILLNFQELISIFMLCEAAYQEITPALMKRPWRDIGQISCCYVNRLSLLWWLFYQLCASSCV